MEQPSDPQAADPSASDSSGKKKKIPKSYKRLDLPSPEQIVQEDFMNNCALRTVLSGAMGSVLGVAFGLFMGTMDSAVSVRCLYSIYAPF